MVDEHANNTEKSGKETHDNLHLHDKSVSNNLLSLHISELNQRKHKTIQSSSSKSQDKPHDILLICNICWSITVPM